MAELTDVSDVLNRLTGGAGAVEQMFPFKTGRLNGSSTAPASPVANRWTSLWQYSGNHAWGAAAGAVAVPTRATLGALGQADATGGRDKWLLGIMAMTRVQGTFVLYDRLLHQGNRSGTVTTAQAVGGTITRNTGGLDNRIFLEIYTQIGTSGPTVTAEYTNQDGTAGRTTKPVTIGSTGYREAQRMVLLPLADGDTGVRSVESFTLSGSTGTAGALGVTLANPIVTLPIGVPGIATARDFIASGKPVLIEPGACLAWAFLANSTSVPELFASLHMVEK